MKSGESKEKEPVKPKVLERPTESMGSEGTILGITGLGLGLRSALKLPSFKVTLLSRDNNQLNNQQAGAESASLLSFSFMPPSFLSMLFVVVFNISSGIVILR